MTKVIKTVKTKKDKMQANKAAALNSCEENAYSFMNQKTKTRKLSDKSIRKNMLHIQQLKSAKNTQMNFIVTQVRIERKNIGIKDRKYTIDDKETVEHLNDYFKSIRICT